MSVSKQHFEAIAAAINASPMDDAAKLVVASHIAAALAPFNARFEAGRFIRAATGHES